MRVFVALLFSAALACGGATTSIDGGPDAAQQDGSQGGSVACNGNTCGQGEVCVVLTSSGGACLMPDDAGVCPDGTHTTGCCNNTSVTYTCTKLPDSCGGNLSCPCAEPLCQCGGCSVADAGVLACECAYP